ncbi:cell division protein FtsZ [Candidatus Nomurabacteria bacterium]|nr:cell division protein FtsZ [Candidatus Nomurabacteria bacterium]
MAEILPAIETFARIKVVGIGGGGGNAVNRMIQSKLKGVEFIVINTDAQALHYSKSAHKFHIGKNTTKGLGAGANPDVGRQAAEENEEQIREALQGAEMVFLTAGFGGGTGSGAAPTIAKVAKEVGALVVGIVTKPFSFEGDRRRRIAEGAIEEIRDKVDTLIIIPNDKISQIIDHKTSLIDAFSTVDEILHQGIQGISDLITINGLVNLDFADVKSIMEHAGSALMGIGQASGDNRAILAVRQAMDSPLLDVSINGARGVLINFTGGRDLGMQEIEEAAKLIHDEVDPEANIIWGTVLDENMTGEIRVTLVATGFDLPRPLRSSVGGSNSFGFGNSSSSSSYNTTIKAQSSASYSSNVVSSRNDQVAEIRRAQSEDISAMVDADLGSGAELELSSQSSKTGLGGRLLRRHKSDPEEPRQNQESDQMDYGSGLGSGFDIVEERVETVSIQTPSFEDDEFDKPAYLRNSSNKSGLNSKLSSSDGTDSDMPDFVKEKL